jgi:hypothetical protein
MATKKTKNTVTLEAIAQLDGKAEDSNNTTPGSLDQIMGESISIYGATSPEEYISQLAEMNQTDLQAHAYKVGLIPVEDRRVLVERLVKEFRIWASRHAPVQNQNNSVGMNDISAEVRKILREGA